MEQPENLCKETSAMQSDGQLTSLDAGDSLCQCDEINAVNCEQLVAPSLDKSQGSNGQFGKFKSAESLLEAYNNLQSEFTKKSQKLSELLKGDNLDNMQKCELKSQKYDNNTENVLNFNNNTEIINNSVVDSLNNDVVSGNEDNASAESVETAVSENETHISKIVGESFDNQVKSFFANNPDAKAYSKDMSKFLLKNPTLAKFDNAIDIAYRYVLASELKKPVDLVDDDEFLDTLLASPKAKQKFERSLLSVRNSASVPRLISGDKGNSVSPSRKPLSNFNDAKKFIMQNYISHS